MGFQDVCVCLFRLAIFFNRQILRTTVHYLYVDTIPRSHIYLGNDLSTFGAVWRHVESLFAMSAEARLLSSPNVHASCTYRVLLPTSNGSIGDTKNPSMGESLRRTSTFPLVCEAFALSLFRPSRKNCPIRAVMLSFDILCSRGVCAIIDSTLSRSSSQSRISGSYGHSKISFGFIIPGLYRSGSTNQNSFVGNEGNDAACQ
ncbi:hypothetical protein F4810DRAFT_415921 [Camillea tinctor]|nr:hypothetical protein F4810DRAFT_415921 [Camillea tinctor]